MFPLDINLDEAIGNSQAFENTTNTYPASSNLYNNNIQPHSQVNAGLYQYVPTSSVDPDGDYSHNSQPSYALGATTRHDHSHHRQQHSGHSNGVDGRRDQNVATFGNPGLSAYSNSATSPLYIGYAVPDDDRDTDQVNSSGATANVSQDSQYRANVNSGLSRPTYNHLPHQGRSNLPFVSCQTSSQRNQTTFSPNMAFDPSMIAGMDRQLSTSSEVSGVSFPSFQHVEDNEDMDPIGSLNSNCYFQSDIAPGSYGVPADFGEDLASTSRNNYLFTIPIPGQQVSSLPTDPGSFQGQQDTEVLDQLLHGMKPFGNVQELDPFSTLPGSSSWYTNIIQHQGQATSPPIHGYNPPITHRLQRATSSSSSNTRASSRGRQNGADADTTQQYVLWKSSTSHTSSSIPRYMPVIATDTASLLNPPHTNPNNPPSPSTSLLHTPSHNPPQHSPLNPPHPSPTAPRTRHLILSPHSRVFACLWPSCIHTAKRKADVERHYNCVHCKAEMELHDCPVHKCTRKGPGKKGGFTRRDHLIEHLRSYHGVNVPKKRGNGRGEGGGKEGRAVEG